MNITNFIEWFINQFMNIARFMIEKLEIIKIYNNVSLLDFIITISIIGMFIPIILTIPNQANKLSRAESRKKEKKK